MTSRFGEALTLALELAKEESVADDIVDAVLDVKFEHARRLHGMPESDLMCGRRTASVRRGDAVGGRTR